jgi:AraC-like DNA-binding protein
MTSGHYQRFDTPGMRARDRFEYWRDWYSRAIDAPMQLEPVDDLAPTFSASAEALSLGDIDIVEYRFGAAIGSWTREGLETSERLRLVIVAPAPGATGSWHNNELSLASGATVLLGHTAGRWRAPDGLHGIQVNAPRDAIPVTDTQLEQFNDQRRLRHDPIYTSLVRPALLGHVGQLQTLVATAFPELSGLWISLLNMLFRSLAGKGIDDADTAHGRLLQARRHIQANLADPQLSPSTVAEALNVSRSALYAALPADTGGVAAEIRRQRLRRAHTMLRDPANAKPIADIAAAVGIPNAAQFSRLFRDRYGLAPRDLRGHRGPPAQPPDAHRGLADSQAPERSTPSTLPL